MSISNKLACFASIEEIPTTLLLVTSVTSVSGKLMYVLFTFEPRLRALISLRSEVVNLTRMISVGSVGRDPGSTPLMSKTATPSADALDLLCSLIWLGINTSGSTASLNVSRTSPFPRSRVKL